MASVTLEKSEWNQILSVLGEVPWKISNPLILRIVQQLSAQENGQVPVGTTDSDGPSLRDKDNSGTPRRMT